MKKIWEYFENLNEIVYVADMDSHELVYMNKRLMENYNFHTKEEYIGKKCYEILQASQAPCAICTNCELKEGQFKEWCYYNPIIGKYFSLKDTMLLDEDRRYRFEIAIDVTMQERQERALLGYRNLETIANEGLRVALQAPTPDKSIDVILEYMGKALRGERTYIFEQNENGGDDNTYEWVASGVTSEKDNLQNLPPEVCANWYRSFREGKNIIIEDIEDIRGEDPLQYENLKRQAIQSLAVVPLYVEGKIVGFYGIDNPPSEFFESAQNMLQIVGHFLVSCMRRRNLENELRKMSYSDSLTGLGNRYAIYEYIRNLPEGADIGVVYCDINGLKQVNDTKGHKAGDDLIIHSCESLRRAFPDAGLFRVGGDELIALCLKTDEAAIAEQIKMLQMDLQTQRIAMAIGTGYGKVEEGNINKPMAKAEKNMYEDKSAYYKRQEK